MKLGLIVDVETTGMDPKKDRIIEIGLLEFVQEEGRTPVVTRMYGAIEDPGVPLCPEIQKLTGLDDPILAGRRIDWSIVQAFFEQPSIVIAHNAAFDRSFLANHDEIRSHRVHWGCSMRHIDWQKHGYKTRSLNYLAADHGFVNPFAHRALFDCATTLRLISPYLEELVARSFLHEYKLIAVGAPFALKDNLKEHGYHWDAEQRVSYKEIFEDVLETEKAFLRDQIYQGQDPYRCEEIFR